MTPKQQSIMYTQNIKHKLMQIKKSSDVLADNQLCKSGVRS